MNMAEFVEIGTTHQSGTWIPDTDSKHKFYLHVTNDKINQIRYECSVLISPYNRV